MNPLLLCENQDEATNFAIDWLRGQGYLVTRLDRGEMIPIGELRERFAPHISAACLCERLQHPDCPPFHAELGPSGRILKIAPSPDLVRWISAPKQPGRYLERRSA